MMKLPKEQERVKTGKISGTKKPKMAAGYRVVYRGGDDTV